VTIFVSEAENLWCMVQVMCPTCLCMHMVLASEHDP
jgi:hypothetical protein